MVVPNTYANLSMRRWKGAVFIMRLIWFCLLSNLALILSKLFTRFEMRLTNCCRAYLRLTIPSIAALMTRLSGTPISSMQPSGTLKSSIYSENVFSSGNAISTAWPIIGYERGLFDLSSSSLFTSLSLRSLFYSIVARLFILSDAFSPLRESSDELNSQLCVSSDRGLSPISANKMFVYCR